MEYNRRLRYHVSGVFYSEIMLTSATIPLLDYDVGHDRHDEEARSRIYGCYPAPFRDKRTAYHRFLAIISGEMERAADIQPSSTALGFGKA